MKNMYLLYGITILAVVGIFVCSVRFTSGTSPMDTPQQSAYTAKSKKALKKKSCACCDEKGKHMSKMMREWLNEKSQEQSLKNLTLFANHDTLYIIRINFSL